MNSRNGDGLTPHTWSVTMKTIVGIAKEGEESGVMCVNTLV